MIDRRLLVISAATAVIWLAAALPTWAHPSFRPGNAPADETVGAELVIPHSCGAEGMPTDDADQSPTTIIDVQVPEGVTITPQPKDDWTLETTSDGFTWTADDPTETTIVFNVDLTLTGNDGDIHYVNVFQECVDGGSFSWIGSPDRDAEHPAVTLTVGDDAADHEHGTDDESEADHADPSDDPTAHESTHPASEQPTEEMTGGVAVDDVGDDGSNAGAIALVGGAVALAGGTGAYLLRRRSPGTPEA